MQESGYLAATPTNNQSLRNNFAETKRSDKTPGTREVYKTRVRCTRPLPRLSFLDATNIMPLWQSCPAWRPDANPYDFAAVSTRQGDRQPALQPALLRYYSVSTSWS